jgi:hypothetical protein
LENFFPIIGKLPNNFSNHWKNRDIFSNHWKLFFQSLENFPPAPCNLSAGGVYAGQRKAPPGTPGKAWATGSGGPKIHPLRLPFSFAAWYECSNRNHWRFAMQKPSFHPLHALRAAALAVAIVAAAPCTTRTGTFPAPVDATLSPIRTLEW